MVLKIICICLFVLFIFSPQYKNHPWLANYPDIAVILSAILIPWFYIQFALYKRQNEQHKARFWTLGTLTIVGFTIWALTSLLWAPETPYALSKAVTFTLFTVHAYLIAEHQLGKDYAHIHLFYKIIFLFSSLVLCETLRIKFFPSPGEQLNNIFGNNYLVTGQTLGIGTLLAFMGSLQSYKTKAINLGFFLVFLLHVAGLLILGARGPVLAALIALALMGGMVYYRNKALRTWNLSVLLGCIVVLTGAFFLNKSLHFATFQRLTSLFDQLDYSTLDRLTYYKSAIMTFMQHFFKGVGTGGWPYYFGLGDLPWHPHNILLETAAELGMVGILLLGSFFYLCLQGCYSILGHSKQPIDLIPIGFWLFSFINGLKTGDLNDNILLFVFSGLVLGLVQGIKRSYGKEELKPSLSKQSL